MAAAVLFVVADTPSAARLDQAAESGRFLITLSLRPDPNLPADDPVGYAIYTAQVDGTRLRRVAFGLGFLGDAVWSPNRSRILFDAPSGMIVMNSDGSHRRLLCRRSGNSPCEGGVWSPDGSKIAYWATRTNRGAIIGVMRADGTHKKQIRHLNYKSTGLDWSPNGSKLAFHIVQWPANGVYVINADGSGLRRVSRDFAAPRWSPDGKQLLALNEDDHRLYTIALGTGKKTPVLREPFWVDVAGWSPGGSRIAFGVNGRTPVRVLDLKTGRTRPVSLRPDACAGIEKYCPISGVQSLDWH